MGPSFANRQDRPDQRPSRDTDGYIIGPSSRGQPKPSGEDIDGRRSPPRRISLEDSKDKTCIKWSPPDEDNKCLGEVLLTIDPKCQGAATDPYAAYGLKVIGGKKTDDGKLGAFITDIRKGGPAERQAQLQIGDEIQEWNDISLVDCTFEEVVESINSSMEDNQDSNELHLIVCRDK